MGAVPKYSKFFISLGFEVVSLLLPCKQEVLRGQETLQSYHRRDIPLSLEPTGAGDEATRSSTRSRSSYSLVFTERSGLHCGAGWNHQIFILNSA